MSSGSMVALVNVHRTLRERIVISCGFVTGQPDRLEERVMSGWSTNRGSSDGMRLIGIGAAKCRVPGDLSSLTCRKHLQHPEAMNALVLGIFLSRGLD